MRRLLNKLPRTKSYHRQKKPEVAVIEACPSGSPAQVESHQPHIDTLHSNSSDADHRSGFTVRVQPADSGCSNNASITSTVPVSPSLHAQHITQRDSDWSSVNTFLSPYPPDHVGAPDERTQERELSPSPALSAASNQSFSSNHNHTHNDNLDADLALVKSLHSIYVEEIACSTASSVQLSLTPAQPAQSTTLSITEHNLPLLPASPLWEPTKALTIDDEPAVMQRKVWVRRSGASATIVVVRDDDLVDTIRDVILHKYANSLGKSIDSPDITLKIVSRDQSNKNVAAERVLGPEESIGQTLDAYYPGGQSIEEALLIEVPQKRTPKPSPRMGGPYPVVYPYYYEDPRPAENARDYFPPMNAASPRLPAHQPHPLQPNGPHPHSMAIMTSGQLGPLPSPSINGSRKYPRPGYKRQHTSSPTIMHSIQSHSNDLNKSGLQSNATPNPLPTPPAQMDHRPSITPPNPRTLSPHPGRSRRKKQPQGQQSAAKAINGDQQLKPVNAGLLDGNVPPISILIVEDNPINLRLLEQFMRRLKVRFKTAMNGREAVNTWRTGGFHLVLMDIQLPVMNGLEATKEIRRLESVNGIGLGLVGAQNANGARDREREIDPEDKLGDINLFKSPVIIVALTASSLQSDRHEALAVGCNDFLTKPVGYPWMSRKVTEWGCMQALIDFDGWRQWKASVEKKDEGLTEEQKKLREKEERAKNKAALKAMFAKPPPSSKDKKDSVEKDAAGKSPTSLNGGSSAVQAPPPRGNRSVRGSSGSGMLLSTHEEEIED